MSTIKILMVVAAGLVGSAWLLNYVSYVWLKRRVVSRHHWDLNICCGRTDGGGVNADIVEHASLPKAVRVDVYQLPFRDQQFERVLCSHTIEHVDDPQALYAELTRVGREVTLLVPPLWDWSAAFNLLEHKWLFLTLRTEHHTLPKRVRLPLARTLQKLLGQRIHA